MGIDFDRFLVAAGGLVQLPFVSVTVSEPGPGAEMAWHLLDRPAAVGHRFAIVFGQVMDDRTLVVRLGTLRIVSDRTGEVTNGSIVILLIDGLGAATEFEVRQRTAPAE